MQLQTGYIYSYPLNIDVSTCTVLHGGPRTCNASLTSTCSLTEPSWWEITCSDPVLRNSCTGIVSLDLTRHR